MRSPAWREKAAGSGGTDIGRPQRIGEFLARAYIEREDAKIAYYELLIANMEPGERTSAVRALDARTQSHGASTEGADEGYQKWLAEAERLGLR